MQGLEEAELAALRPRCLLSRLTTVVAGRSGVSANEEWMEGPYCMGEGAGGAKGEGSCSAAFEFIAFAATLLSSIGSLPNYSGFSTS